MNKDYNFDVKRTRPEEEYEKVTDYFHGEILSQYASSKSMMRIQQKITRRSIELLGIESREGLILDAGCGPGFAAIYLKEIGFEIVALDLISEFLKFYDINDLNPINADMCFSPFKSETFDAIISISALQWIFRDADNNLMQDMLKNLSKSFYRILKPDRSVVIQFYPKSKKIMDCIGKIIVENTDFHCKFVLDNPLNNKKRKIFLLLNKKPKFR